MSTECPDESWSLARLGNFCSTVHKKLAVQAWRFGHALNLARSKNKKRGEWQVWKDKFVPGLGHSSEHRYRTLASSLPEESLVGIGLTEAYRLLDLAGAPAKGTRRGDPFAQSPQPVVAGGGRVPPTQGGLVATGCGDPDEDGPDDSDDLAELPAPAHYRDRPPASRSVRHEGDEVPHRIAVGPMGHGSETEAFAPLVGHDGVTYRIGTGPVDDGLEYEAVVPPGHTRAGGGSPGERYKTLLRDARTHLVALRSWSDWLKQRDEIFLVEMWDKHGVDGDAAQISQAVESLRWVAENLEW